MSSGNSPFAAPSRRFFRIDSPTHRLVYDSPEHAPLCNIQYLSPDRSRKFSSNGVNRIPSCNWRAKVIPGLTASKILRPMPRHGCLWASCGTQIKELKQNAHLITRNTIHFRLLPTSRHNGQRRPLMQASRLTIRPACQSINHRLPDHGVDILGRTPTGEGAAHAVQKGHLSIGIVVGQAQQDFT